jgi:hypothetical protein
MIGGLINNVKDSTKEEVIYKELWRRKQNFIVCTSTQVQMENPTLE